MFVIDNSGSMADEQDNLARSIPQFVETLTETLDLETFHLGTMTSDTYDGNPIECSKLGAFVVSTVSEDMAAEKCGPYTDGHTFMTHNDVDLAERLQCAAKPGISGSGNERPMEAMVRAMGNHLNKDGSCNDGFHRDGSLLVIVVITDEEDSPFGDAMPEFTGSDGDPRDWFDAVVDRKGDSRNVVVLSLVGVAEPNECEVPWDSGDGAELNVRIKEFTEMFDANGSLGDVCADNYGPFFDKAVSVIATACDNQPE